MKTLPSTSRKRSSKCLFNWAPQPAFTRLGLAALLATLACVATVAGSALANTTGRADQVACLSNRRQVIRAFHLWAAEHKQTLPWWRPASERGTSGAALGNNAWLQFAWLSNELGSPKILHDPADKERLTAVSWTGDPAGGFLNFRYRNRAISYTLGIDAAAMTVPGEDGLLTTRNDFALAERHILLTDRHMEVDVTNSGCASGLTVSGVYARPARVGWKETQPTIHGAEAGNVGLLDGSVHQVNRVGLHRLLETGDDNGYLHSLFP